MSRRAFIVLDRDGTVIEERHYLSDPAGLAILPGVPAALRAFHALGFGLVLLTNQSGLARGLFDVKTLDAIHGRLQDELAESGVFLDGIYHCPHLPEEGCSCRKPALGMIRQAQEELGLDPCASYMIGDKACDIGVGLGAGLRTVLVRSGYGSKEEKTMRLTPHLVADGLPEAFEMIRQEMGRAGQGAAGQAGMAGNAHDGTGIE